MRVLLVTSEAPLPPPGGGRLVVEALLRHLQPEHQVRVVAIRSRDQDPAELEPGVPVELVEPVPDDPLHVAVDLGRALASGWPPRVEAQAGLLGDPVRRQLAKFRPDVVHLLPGAMVGLVDAVDNIPTVLTALDAIHLNIRARALEVSAPRRLALAWKRRRWERCVANTYPRFDAVTVVTGEDRLALRELAPRARIEVVPNGVDTKRFRPNNARSAGRRIAFHGVLRYPPNVTAARFLAEQVVPRVRDVVPDANLDLVGLDPTSDVRALARLPGVTVTGWVDDIAATLGRADVYVCPMTSGTGIKNKLLEAMACGLPCVATPLATQGLAVTDDVHLCIHDSAREIAGAVIDLLRHRDRAAELGVAARRYVVDHHAWRSTVDDYVSLYRSVAGGET